MWETTSGPCRVTVTTTVVCVSFGHYADGMIPIMTDRGSHCKHQRGEKKWTKIVCLCTVSGGSSIQRLSAPASVSWLQTSMVAPHFNYAHSVFSTYSPFLTCFLSGLDLREWESMHWRHVCECVRVCARQKESEKERCFAIALSCPPAQKTNYQRWSEWRPSNHREEERPKTICPRKSAIWKLHEKNFKQIFFCW